MHLLKKEEADKTAAQISRERATFQFEEAVDKLAEDTSNSYNLVSWCKNVQQFNYEIIKTDEAIIYWTNREFLKVESDKLLKYNGVSIGTAIKQAALSRVPQYNGLNNKAKHVVGLSLNSIVDLSDDSADGQKLYFDDAAWEEMKKCYRIKTSHHCHLKDYRKQLAKLNKCLKNMGLVKAYKVARKLEIDSLDSIDEKVYKIYAYM